MRRPSRGLWIVPALVAALAVWGCEQSTPRILGPSGGAESRSAVDPKLVDAQLSTDTAFTLVKDGSTTPGTYSITVGPTGGRLGGQGGYALIVPAGAVTDSTTFTVTVPANGLVYARFRATRVEADGTVTDVGAQGFNVPVVIQFPWGVAKKIDAGELSVLWAVDGTPDGALRPVPTLVDSSARLAYGFVSHFSDYSLGFGID